MTSYSTATIPWLWGCQTMSRQQTKGIATYITKRAQTAQGLPLASDLKTQKGGRLPARSNTQGVTSS